MSPHTFPTSPSRSGEQRKFVNPTPGWVGANVFGPDGKPTAVAVEPGGEVWLTPEEERMTAEAPRLPDDNPFTKAWDEPIAWDPVTGEPTQHVARHGTLVLADEPARPIASDRFIPPRGSAEDLRATREAMEGLGRDASGEPLKPIGESAEDTDGLAAAAEMADDDAHTMAYTSESSESGDEQETVTGAPPLPKQPPVEGQPSPDEVVGTPEAVAANDRALSERESTAEQRTVKRETADTGGAISV